MSATALVFATDSQREVVQCLEGICETWMVWDGVVNGNDAALAADSLHAAVPATCAVFDARTATRREVAALITLAMVLNLPVYCLGSLGTLPGVILTVTEAADVDALQYAVAAHVSGIEPGVRSLNVPLGSMIVPRPVAPVDELAAAIATFIGAKDIEADAVVPAVGALQLNLYGVITHRDAP